MYFFSLRQALVTLDRLLYVLNARVNEVSLDEVLSFGQRVSQQQHVQDLVVRTFVSMLVDDVHGAKSLLENPSWEVTRLMQQIGSNVHSSESVAHDIDLVRLIQRCRETRERSQRAVQRSNELGKTSDFPESGVSGQTPV